MDSGYAHRFGLKQWLVCKKLHRSDGSHDASPDHVIVTYKKTSDFVKR